MIKKSAIYLILIGLCLLVYANSLNNAFVSDDIPAILKNPQISQFFLFWLDPHSLFNSFSYLIAGYTPFIYHLISVIMHSINTILVFLFLRTFFNTKSSFLGACLFAVHPIHTEAVTWISGRSYVLLTFFILIAYLLYYRAMNIQSKDKQSHLLWYTIFLATFSYYIINHYTLFLLFPLLLILTDLTFGKWRKNWKWWLPVIAIVIARTILLKHATLDRIYFMKHVGGVPPVKNPIVYFIYSFYSHFRLLIWPIKLTLYHEPAIIPLALIHYWIFYLIPIILLLIFTFKKAKEIFFGLSIFIIFLAPTYSPIPIACPVAERYIYFPSIALSIAVAFIYESYASKFEKFKKHILAILIVIIFVYGIRTVVRNQDWKTPETFWRKAVEVSPNSTRVHTNLGLSYAEGGDISKAIEEYNKAIQINPNYSEAYNNRGFVYGQKGNLNQAISDYNKAIQINPNYSEAYNNRGFVYGQKGNLNQAISDYNKAIQINPNYSEAYNNRGITYQNQGNLNQALSDYNKAIQINSNLAEAYNNRGITYQNQGNLNQALSDYNKAIQINPNYSEAYNNRGVAYYMLKEYDKAWVDVHKAEGLGFVANPAFLNALKEASGRDK